MSQSTRSNWKLFAACSVLLSAGAMLAIASGYVPSVAASPKPYTTAESSGEKAMNVKSAPLPETPVSNRMQSSLPAAEPASPKKIEHANESTFDELVLNANGPVLVDFYAEWCRPCRALGPVLEDFARETSNVRVVKVNVDESPELAAKYRVSGIPNLKLFSNGRVTGEHMGMASKAELRSLVGR